MSIPTLTKMQLRKMPTWRWCVSPATACLAAFVLALLMIDMTSAAPGSLRTARKGTRSLTQKDVNFDTINRVDSYSDGDDASDAPTPPQVDFLPATVHPVDNGDFSGMAYPLVTEAPYPDDPTPEVPSDPPTEPPTPAATTPQPAWTPSPTEEPTTSTVPSRRPAPSPTPQIPTSLPEGYIYIRTPPPTVYKRKTPKPTTAQPTAPPADSPFENNSATTPSRSPTPTLPPEDQDPQAGSEVITGSAGRKPSTWPLLFIVGSVATIGMVTALLIWNNTRTTNKPNPPVDLQTRSKNSSIEIDFGWHESPSLLSNDVSVDTFMGRKPIPRKESDPNVSSRAGSAGELLNVSSVNESKSTRSDPSNRSQPAQKCQDQADVSTSPNDLNDSSASSIRSERETTDREQYGDDDRPSSPLSVEDVDDELADWANTRSDTSDSLGSLGQDAGVQTFFGQQTFLQVDSEDSIADARIRSSSGWTTTLPRTYGFHHAAFSPTVSERSSERSTSLNGEVGDDEESRSKSARDSCDSVYLMVPSCNTAILGECSFSGSFNSEWSNRSCSGWSNLSSSGHESSTRSSS